MKLRLSWVTIPACAFLGGIFAFLQQPLTSPALSPSIARALPSSPTASSESSKEFTSEESSRLPITNIAQAVREASLFTSRLHRRYELARIADQLRSEDFPALLQQHEAERSTFHWRDKCALVELWTEKDPQAAVAFVAEHSTDLRLWKAVAKGWARRDPAAALTWAMSQPLNKRRDLFVALQEACFDSEAPNPSAIIQAALQTCTDSKDRFARGDMMRLFSVWAQHDSAAAETLAWNLKDETQKSQALEAILRSIVDTDPGRALELFARMPFPDPQRRMWAGISLAGEIAANDTTLAKQFAESLPAGVERARATGEIAKAMLESNLEEAFALAESVPLDASEGLDYFYLEIAESDPATALRLCTQRLDRMDAGSGPRKALQNLFDYSLVTQWGKWTHPTDVAAFLAAETNPQRQSALTKLLPVWMNRDSAAAMAWVETLPSGAAREYALAGMAEGRASKSIPETISWLSSLPKGPEYAAAVQGFAATAFTYDPDGALAWIRTIPDAADRQRRLLASWTRWIDTFAADPNRRADAERWRDTSPELTQEERQMLKYSD
ncbi:hypothetical protein ACXR0O_28155 [Verrucomicrobiota bacterium sgz303538]